MDLTRTNTLPQAELQMEQLDDNNSWYCPKCKAHVPASKKLDLWQLPGCLVIHLKRFTQGRLSQKLDLPVDYPLAGLDLGQYVLKNQVCGPYRTPNFEREGTEICNECKRGRAEREASVFCLLPSAFKHQRCHEKISKDAVLEVMCSRVHSLLPFALQDKAPVYDLFAVSNHFGGLGGGHYTAYAQLPPPSAADADDAAAGHGAGLADSTAGCDFTAGSFLRMDPFLIEPKGTALCSRTLISQVPSLAW